MSTPTFRKAIPKTPPMAEPIEKPGPNYVSIHKAELELVWKARVDPYVYIAYVSGQIPAGHHRRWLKRIFDWIDPINKRLAFIAPRESAKSTVVVWAMSWFIARHPWLTNVIVSVAKDQAEKRMTMLKQIIETNQRFKNVFPWIKVDYRKKNTQTEFTLEATAVFDPETGKIMPIRYNQWQSLLSRYGSLKDPTLRTGGVGSKTLIGSRISGMLMLDDIVDGTMLNPEIQQEVYDWVMTTLIPLLQEHAKAIFIGTRWMIGDVAQMIMENEAWYSETITALYTDPDTGEMKSYWPEYWSVERLLAKKKEIGDLIFEVMYMNNPRAMMAAKFKLDSLDQDLPDPMPELTAVYIGTDFASSLKQRADWTVYAAVGFDALGRLYILDMERLKGTPDELMDSLMHFCDRVLDRWHKLTWLLFENVAFQAWAEHLIRQRNANLPIDKVRPVGDKGHRLEPLAVKFNDKMGYINKKMREYPTFKHEAINFGAVPHDDTVDAVTIVTSYVNATSGGTTSSVVYAKSEHLR